MQRIGIQCGLAWSRGASSVGVEQPTAPATRPHLMFAPGPLRTRYGVHPQSVDYYNNGGGGESSSPESPAMTPPGGDPDDFSEMMEQRRMRRMLRRSSTTGGLSSIIDFQRNQIQQRPPLTSTWGSGTIVPNTGAGVADGENDRVHISDQILQLSEEQIVG